jgi:hypothetical protein
MTRRFRDTTVAWGRGRHSSVMLGPRSVSGRPSMENILVIVAVVLIVLFVLGYFGRGRFRA